MKEGKNEEKPLIRMTDHRDPEDVGSELEIDDKLLGPRGDAKRLEETCIDRAAILRTHLISPIHDAAAKGNIVGMENVIKDGVDGVHINSLDKANNTALHWAAGADHAEAVSWLIQNGADLNAQNLLGDTALHRAVWRNHRQIVSILLRAGINVKLRNKDGKKAIELVRDAEIGEMLLKYDTDFLQELEMKDQFADVEDGVKEGDDFRFDFECDSDDNGLDSDSDSV